MYTRSYGEGEKEMIRIPEKYDGTVFMDSEEKNKESNESQEIAASKIHNEKLYGIPCEPEKKEVCDTRHDNHRFDLKSLGSFDFLKKIPFFNSFSEKGFGNFLPIKFGSEEILIMAVLAFLIFTKSADIESILMIFLLLIIK